MRTARALGLTLAGGAAAVFGIAFWVNQPELQASENLPVLAAAGNSFSADHLTPEVRIQDLRAERCEAQIAEIRKQPGLSGAAVFEKNRLEILSRTKMEPLLFVRAPAYEEDVRPRVQGLRWQLQRSHPFTALKGMRTHFSNYHDDARQLLLPDGYLWAEDSETAQAIATWIKPEHLFGHDQIWIQRGERLYHARRKPDRSYVWTDGEHEGKSVQLMPLDRVGVGDVPDGALHRDVRSLQHRLYFSAMRPVHLTESHIVAELKYGDWWVPTLLASQGPHLERVCEVANVGLEDKLRQLRDEAAKRQRAAQVMRQTVLEEIDEALPFDEPKREYGRQLDGKLRGSWWAAYQRHKLLFDFGADEYAVYDEQGRAHVPQVCIDFLMDTFERMSGTWFTPRQKAPRRVVGKLDFSQVADPEALRQVSTFIDFASARTDWFETYTPPWSKRVRLGVIPSFLDYLERMKDEFRVGDMILIRGRTPWDPRRMHYHSYVVYESDPLSGVPMYLAGNAARPSIRVWQTEGDRTPDRYIVFRIRPRLEWLMSLLPDDVAPPEQPLSLGPSRG